MRDGLVCFEGFDRVSTGFYVSLHGGFIGWFMRGLWGWVGFRVTRAKV